MSECIKNREGRCSGTCFNCLNSDAVRAIDDVLGGGDNFRGFVNEHRSLDEAPPGLLLKIRDAIQGEPPSSSDNSIQN